MTAEPAFHQIARWPRSIAQYTVGHQARLKQIEARVGKIPGLYLAGNGYYGIRHPRLREDAAAASEPRA